MLRRFDSLPERTAVVALAFACQCQAGEPAATRPQPQPLEEVVVTGSLLEQDATELSPLLTTLTREQIRQSGMTTVADALRALPADNSGSLPTAYSGGSAAGASGV